MDADIKAIAASAAEHQSSKVLLFGFIDILRWLESLFVSGTSNLGPFCSHRQTFRHQTFKKQNKKKNPSQDTEMSGDSSDTLYQPFLSSQGSGPEILTFKA